VITTDDAKRKAIEAVWRVESARLIGGLVRMVRDLGLAEDLAQEALVTALDRWPETGIPENPGAWLMATAKNHAVDQLRRHRMAESKHEVIEKTTDTYWTPDFERALDEVVGDDLLRLIFIACHPVLSAEARVALTLKLLGGLKTEEIARAFLAPEPTIAQRIVRAKRTIAEARVPFEVPRGAELTARLPAVLEVVYLIFNEGYAAARGDEWIRLELCEDALRLGRILCALVPSEAEAHGLVALMELHASRLRARVDNAGEPILLLDQDRTRWDRLLIQRGLAALARAESLARPLGPYSLQAAIVACHARARTVAETDWHKIIALYDALFEISGSPIVELNRAVAVGMAFGPAAGLEIVDTLMDEPALRAYHLLPSVRADLLVRMDRIAEAGAEFERAAALAQNSRERDLLLSRAEACETEAGVRRSGPEFERPDVEAHRNRSSSVGETDPGCRRDGREGDPAHNKKRKPR
jgi:RNA polymerase sigma factor (sigma-70 family)